MNHRSPLPLVVILLLLLVAARPLFAVAISPKLGATL